MQAGQQQLPLHPLLGRVRNEGPLGADQALPHLEYMRVGGVAGHVVHHGWDGVGVE